ncbi:hypothetical protein LCGC14_1574390 [marine sediment metagenome]|uniref:DNA-directed DNA polymerase n=1 Tax=marine sediment metagenome TaxID=412755 RepID=A0A0F9J4X2_9ZZZZ
MFGVSDGNILRPDQIPKDFFTRRYRGKNFAVWNLKFDSGSILHHLPVRSLEILRRDNKVSHDGYRYTYYPHKFLRISQGKNAVTFWDLMPFYGSSLEAAAQRYLGEGKKEIRTKRFTRDFVKANWREIGEYCVRDCWLTKRLGEVFLANLRRFGLRPSALYSQASISFNYFRDNAGIVDVWPMWRSCKRLLRFACEAYAGGKFEVTTRGRFTGHEYDINSAYPFEISKLLDLKNAKIVYTPEPPPDADYGFCRVDVHISAPHPHSIPIKLKTLNTFPIGTFSATITKAELEWLRAHHIPVKIKEAYWIKCASRKRPYADVIANLFKLKAEYKGKDPGMYYTVKTFSNGFYGKLVQLTPQPNGSLRAGPGWNPVYGAIVTANTRLRVSEFQRRLGKACLAVHTDSIITTREIPKSELGADLGDWAHELSGEGVIITSGIYQLGHKLADRGFRLRAGPTWLDRLREHPKASKLHLKETRPLSWLDALHRSRPDDINLFLELDKTLDLNCDRKRLWTRKASGASLLRGREHSAPRVVYQ